MLDRRFFLRAMFLSLLLTGAAGVMLVFVQSWDVFGRLLATGFFAAFATALMAWFAGWVDDAPRRPAGLWAMGVVLALFALSIAALWCPDVVFPGYDLDWRLWLTLFSVAAVGAWSIVCFRGLAKPAAKRAAGVGLVLGAIELILLLTIIWTDETGLTWFLSLSEVAAGLAWFGFFAVACLVGWESGDRRHWRWIGVAAAAVAWLMLLVHTVRRTDSGEEAFVVTASLAGFMAYLNLATLVPLRDSQRWLRWVTIGAAALTMLMIDLAVIDDASEEFAARLGGAAGIICACGSLALLVLARLNRTVDVDTVGALPMQIRLICPRCRRRQHLPIGAAACAACGLRITTKIEEPRCGKCGYLLYNLRGTSCPECGEPIATPGIVHPPPS